MDTTDHGSHQHQILQGRIYVYPFSPCWRIKLPKSMKNATISDNSNNNTFNVTTATPDWIVIQNLIHDSYSTPDIKAEINAWTKVFTVYIVSIFASIFLVPYLIFDIFLNDDVYISDRFHTCIQIVVVVALMVYLYRQYQQQQTIVSTIQDNKYLWMRLVVLSILIWIWFSPKAVYFYWMLEGVKIASPHIIVCFMQWLHKTDKLMKQIYYNIKDKLSERQDMYCQCSINYDFQSIVVDVYTENMSSTTGTTMTKEQGTTATYDSDDPNVLSYEANDPLLAKNDVTVV